MMIKCEKYGQEGNNQDSKNARADIILTHFIEWKSLNVILGLVTYILKKRYAKLCKFSDDSKMILMAHFDKIVIAE